MTLDKKLNSIQKGIYRMEKLLKSVTTKKELLTFIVTDYSIAPADKFNAQLVMDDIYYGAHTWLRYVSRQSAFNCCLFLEACRDRPLIVLEEIFHRASGKPLLRHARPPHAGEMDDMR